MEGKEELGEGECELDRDDVGLPLSELLAEVNILHGGEQYFKTERVHHERQNRQV